MMVMECGNVLSEILDFIKPGDAGQGHVCYYRGQYGFSYPPCPSAMRNKQDIPPESDIVANLIALKPGEYADCDDIERLAKMEHAGIPTRLLNISRSPLVSLFFSCDNLEEYKHGLFDKNKPSYVFKYELVNCAAGKINNHPNHVIGGGGI